MNKDVECPYYGAWNEVCHDDGQGYEEDIKHEMECCECEKRFVFTTYISFSYESEKADCLNDGKHDFRPTITCPKICTKMQCTLCDEEREPTTEEWRKILTPDEFAKAKTEYQWITKL